MSSTKYAINLDQADADTLYVGEAPIGAATSESRWRISRILTSGTITSVKWADGDQDYNNVWDNRASLTYL